jgi:hypothetical protein
MLSNRRNYLGTFTTAAADAEELPPPSVQETLME